MMMSGDFGGLWVVGGGFNGVWEGFCFIVVYLFGDRFRFVSVLFEMF